MRYWNWISKLDANLVQMNRAIADAHENGLPLDNIQLQFMYANRDLTESLRSVLLLDPGMEIVDSLLEGEPDPEMEFTTPSI